MRSLLFTALLAAAAAMPVSADAAAEYRYTMLIDGRAAGAHVTRIADDGSVETEFSYRSNGRGPDYKEKIRLDRAGSIARFAISGTSTYGSIVDERFEAKPGVGEWAGVVDRGTVAVAGRALYVPIESTIEVAGLTARALIRAGAPVQGIPGGQLSIRKLAEARVANGSARQEVALYAVTGIDLQPQFIWMTADGERAFAVIYPGFGQLIAQGWEGQAGELEQRQVSAREALSRDIAGRNRHALAQPLLIRNARVFDAERAVLGAPQDVYVNHGRIAAVFEAGSSPQGAATVIDAGGRVLLPGLFDMHGHLSPEDFLLNLAAGVTTVRDLGNDNATLARLIDQIDRHEAIGPHVVPAGFIEGKSGFSASNGILVDSLAEAKQAVDFYAQHGFPQIKIYNSFKPEWVAETTAYAHARGLRVSGHVPAFMKAEDAVRAGYDELQHINQVLLNFLVRPDTDTRTLERFTLVAERARKIDLDGKPFRDFVDLLVARKTVLDPTVAVFEGQFTQKPGEMNRSYAAIADHLPTAPRRSLQKSDSELTDEMAPRWRASFRRMVEAVGRFHRAGITLVAGTDAFAGFTLQRELELYVEAGIPAAEVLRIATWNGALVSRVLADRGSIERGKRADLILVDGDPTRDIAAIRNVVLVLQDGDAYYPDELHRELGIRPFAASLRPLPR